MNSISQDSKTTFATTYKFSNSISAKKGRKKERGEKRKRKFTRRESGRKSDELVEVAGLITKEGEAKLNLLISRACTLDILAQYPAYRYTVTNYICNENARTIAN